MKNKISLIIAVIAGSVFSGVSARFMDKTAYDLPLHMAIFVLIALGIFALLHYAAIWQDTARRQGNEYAKIICAHKRMAEERDNGVGERQEAACVSVESDNDLIDDDHPLTEEIAPQEPPLVQEISPQKALLVHEISPQKSPLMQERARSSLKRKRRIRS